MSRIPVFIERSARKGWNTTVESCIFIACDSVETSSEIGDVHELVTEKTDFNAVNDTSDELEDYEDRLIDKVQLNDTQESRLDEVDRENEADPLQDRNRNRDNTADTLTVVSCSRGVINSTCNCNKCGEGVSVKEFVTSFQGGVMRAKENEAQVKSVRSQIPRPTRLTAGKVALTPAPLNKAKSRSVKKSNLEKNQSVAPRHPVQDNVKKLHENGKLDKCLHSATKNENWSKQTCVEHFNKKNNIDKKTIEREHANTVAENKEDSDRDAKHQADDVLDRTIESGLYRSQHDLEDSEPEYAQHEMQNGGHGPSSYLESFMKKTNGIKADINTRLADNQSITEVVHTESLGGFIEKDSVDKGSIKLVRGITPRGSCIPKFQHHKNSENEKYPSGSKWKSPKAHCVSVSTNNSVTPRTYSRGSSRDSNSSRNSSVSPNRNSVMSTCGTISPSPRSRLSVKLSKSNSTDGRRSSSSNERCLNRSSKSSMVVLNTPKVYETKASKLRRQVFKGSNGVHDDYDNIYGGRQSGSRNIHDSAAVPILKKCDVEVSNQSRRNLPRAPAEVRKIRYGQRCVVNEDDFNDDDLTVSQSRPTASGRTSGGRPPSGPSAAPSSSGGGGGKARRPAWDLKGRLQDVEEQYKKKEQETNTFLLQMQKCTDRIALLENHNDQLSGTVAQKEESYTHASKEIEQLQKKLRGTEDELYDVKRQFERDTENFEFTKASLRRQKESLEGEINGLQQEVAGLKSSVAQLTSSQAGLKSELDATKLALDQANGTIVQRDSTIQDLQQKLADQIAVSADLNSKCREHETVRRKLHNTIQELKGNIRVFCRVRPLLGDELLGNDGEIHHMNFPDEEQKTLELERLADVSLSESTLGGNRKGNGKYEFNFDKVFGPTSKQSEVFEEISQLVQSALDGYNVCIFAYGQTGSGKTYTMEGPSIEDEENRGMISRAVLQIFSSTRELEDKGWQYEFEGSFLEIYNESIRDLLGNHAADVKHDIKMTGTGGNDVMVTNLTTVPIKCEDQITDLLKMASKNRAVGETNCNERSSRSHSVFRLKIIGCNDITQEQCKGTLNLVDLAGSERLKDSGATGQRLKETQNINKSLSNLGNVIMALGNKENHVPYRNSKLTYLLQNSLGGNSKTLMFVNVSPREENFSETLNSLRFATKVNQCNIGTATKKVK